MTATDPRNSTVGRFMERLGLAGIVAIAVLRCLVVFAPEVRFDVDPALDPDPLGGLGPAGSLVLDALLLAASAVTLAGAGLRRRAVGWPLLVLAIMPAPIVAWHAAGDLGDLWRGATWLSAVVAASVIASSTGDRAGRIAIAALLLAVVAPLMTRGAMQLTVEHADTVAAFEENRDRFYLDRGWEPDSAAARTYERRLRQARPRGWFTTTNIFASVMTFACVALAGLTAAAFRRRFSSGWIGLAATMAVAAAAGVVLSGSKGAVMTLVAGAAVLVVGRALPARPRWAGSVVLLAVVAAALAGVVVRGLLPEDFAGDRSLLFRWHYLVASGRIIVDHVGAGVGPDGYQAAYAFARVLRNPEEVVSAHSVFVDWLAMLGILGAAWAVMTLALLWRAGTRREGDTASGGRGIAIVFAVAVTLLVFPAAISVELHALDALTLTHRLLGATGFLVAAIMIATVLDRADGRVVGWSFAAASAALVMHAQIEMTCFEPSAVVWAMGVVALAGGVREERAGRGGVVAAVVVGLGAVWLTIAGVAPAVRQQRLVNVAAGVLSPYPDDRSREVAVRIESADLLEQADAVMPSNVRPAQAAVQQLLLACAAAEPVQRLQLLRRAADRAERLARERERGSTVNLAVNAAVALAAHTHDTEDWQRAADWAERLTEIDPNGLFAWRRLGDVRYQAGAADAAGEAYRRALEIDGQLELDPLRRLSDRDRARIRRRVDPEGR